MKPEQMVIIGTARLASRCLEAGLASRSEVVCLEPENDGFSPLAAVCRKRGIEYHLMEDRGNLLRYLVSINRPTLVVSAFSPYIFPREVMQNQALDIINFHNALLPRHRGRNAPTWTIFEMDPVTGITWHQVNAEIDMGDIIIQKRMDIPRDITALELMLQTLDLGTQAFQEILPSLLDGSYFHRPMPREGKGNPHRSTDMPNGGVLDTDWKIEQACAFLRALDYGRVRVFPLPRVRWSGKELPITGYRIRRNVPVENGSAIMFDDHKQQLILHDQGTRLEIHCGSSPV
jgi:methionyl-tRNA formyltransferase